ncbi:hypothetical protein P167DRAFT_515522 [Morchella conica CCBAS932]|uniref:DNA endonuclease activator Ctp1 C-terminal domain-containing protein n=1 Tax=Morchella conica CCBAS932 TaxID=1392247 RepID=A0A3N4L9C1_9PEZI|nr:hypothetical protein P167DRAFT_515522 [Morchella conica CCBAS932]
MDIIERHRIAFSNIGSQLFGDLEKDLELALKKGVEEQAEQDKVIEDLNRRLQEQELLLGVHERSKSEHLKKIADQKDEIHHLKCELAEAVVENGNLEELLAVKSDRGLRRKVLGTPPREQLQDKENLDPLPPVLNHLTSPLQKLPTLERPVSPPHKSSIQTSRSPNLTSDRSVQTEYLYSNDQTTQTSSIQGHEDLTEAFYELSTRYDSVRNETLKLKKAYLGLQEKYIKNRKVWEAWIKTDKERIEQTKKRKREGTVMPEDGGLQLLDSNTTSMAPKTGRTPYTKPPPLSPYRPILIPELSHAIPTKTSLFAKFKGSTGKPESEDLGVDICTSAGTKDVKNKAVLPVEKVHSELTESDEDPPSLSETPRAEIKAVNTTRESPKSTPTTTPQDRNASSTQGENSESRDIGATPTQKLYDRPPLAPPRLDTVFNVPNARGETHSRCIQEGGSIARPVVIKSETSVASSEGFGYHLYEQESLDLDDIGHKPDTPRKKQRIANSLLREGSTSSVTSSGRPGWSNGGFTVKKIPGAPQTQDLMMVEDTQDEDEGIMWNNEDETLSPASPLSTMHPAGAPYRPEISRIPPGITNIKSTVPPHMGPDTGTVIYGGENQRVNNDLGSSPPLIENINQPPLLTPTRRALPAARKPKSGRDIPEKSKIKRRTTARDSIAQITEDGTDGIDDIDTYDISEEQRKREGIPKLSEMLHSPAPKTPSLEHLKKKMGAWSSAPPKRTLRKGSENPGSTSEPPNRKTQKDWVDALTYPERKQKSNSRQSKLDISHFRVNPKVNGGRDYAFVETVRDRGARKCLPGCAKTCCKGLIGFVEAAGLPSPPPKGPRWRSSPPPASTDTACDEEGEVALDARFTARFGRHRDAFPRRKSPPGFWDADFPDTQDLERQHGAAEEMRLRKIEEMRREAEKGEKGRYIYKNR